MLLHTGENTFSGPNSTHQKPRICLESSVFDALFAAVEERRKVCRNILQDASEKRIECYVSALMLVECEGPPDSQILPTQTAETTAAGTISPDLVLDYFESEFLIRCNVDPFVSELARRLKRELNHLTTLTPQQWLWLATALLQHCDYLMTYEHKLLKLAGQSTLGSLKVVTPCRPWSSGQLSLQDLDGVMNEEMVPALGVISTRSIQI